VNGAVDGGFSGEAPSEYCDRPESACEDQVTSSAGTARLTLVGGSGSPLRGDKPRKPAANNQDQEQPGRDVAAGLLVAVSGGPSGQQQGRVPRPPRDFETVFGVVGPVWARLERTGARRKVVEAARRELVAIAGVTGSAAAGRVLTDRLMRRLAEQGGPAAVKDAVGWLIGRGLPRRADCSDLRCDEGLRMDTGGPCETCGYLVTDRRSLRHQVAAKVDADMPTATAKERRATYEQRLRETVARQLADAQECREPEGPLRGECGDCGARIVLAGRALVDGLCRLCRERAESSAGPAVAPLPATCVGWDGVPCDRPALPTRTVCVRHRARELAAEPKTY
jgi:hypothetical protein